MTHICQEHGLMEPISYININKHNMESIIRLPQIMALFVMPSWNSTRQSEENYIRVLINRF